MALRANGCIRDQWARLRRRSRASVAWDHPAGPEATDAELALLWPENEAQRIQARAFLDGDWAARKYTGDEAPRRALEAVLAAAAGVPAAEWKTANAHRPWIELYREAYEDGKDDSLGRIAVWLEKSHRAVELGLTLAAAFRPQPGPELAALIATLGPGQRSGVLADYSRAELCKLLAYRQRDAADLSDDDLRAMALDKHAVPRWAGAPSHAELACRYAKRYADSEASQPKCGRKAARMCYGALLRDFFVDDYSDDGEMDRYQLSEQLAEAHPLLAAVSLTRPVLERLCEANGIATRFPEQAENRANSTKRYETSLDARFGHAFRAFLDSFGGGHLSSVVGHGSDGEWSKRLTRECARGFQPDAFYSREAGEIHLHPRFDALIARAERGTACPEEIYQIAATIAHELLHIASGSNSYFPTNPKWTIEEGATEALARLYADDLARRMGLWREQTDLRATAHACGYRDSIYVHEVEAMVTTAAACSGELDLDTLRCGGYRDPEALSERARAFLTELHTRTRLEHREFASGRRLTELYGGTRDMTIRALDHIYQLPGRHKVGWSYWEVEKRDAEGGVSYECGWVKTHDSYSEQLADTFELVLGNAERCSRRVGRAEVSVGSRCRRVDSAALADCQQ
jgi:hypothetical protein